MTETTDIKRRIYGRLERLGMKEQKEDIVFSFTSGRTSHLSAMHDEELLALLEKLGGQAQGSDYEKWGRFDIRNRQHRYMLSMCQQLGWITYNPRLARNVADIVRLGRWISNFCAVKKPLTGQTQQELQQTIYQMEQMVIKHFTKK